MAMPEAPPADGGVTTGWLRSPWELPHGFKLWTAFEQVSACREQLGEEWRGQTAFEAQLADLPGRSLAGYCAVCRERCRFAIEGDPAVEPNWRETLRCEGCGLINRWRASLHLFRMLGCPDGPVYVTEQTTALFAHLAETRAGVIGSEFVEPGRAPGEQVEWCGRQLRHEDVTRLSFADRSLAAVLTFDVLEHVPDCDAALAEFCRVLAPGGLLLLTAPFSIEARASTRRAQLCADGSIEHLLPPMHHGDPLSPDGVLCFHEFGWDLVDRLHSLGFSEVGVISVWAPAFGYLGIAQPFIVARRA